MDKFNINNSNFPSVNTNLSTVGKTDVDPKNRYKYLQEQSSSAVINSFTNYMDIKVPQQRNWAYAYEAAKYASDNINYIYREADDPREALSSDIVGEMIHNLYPSISKEMASKNARSIVKEFTGDDMSMTNVLELATEKVKQGITGIGVGFQTLNFLFNDAYLSDDPEIREQKMKDQQKMINAKLGNLKRTDYYNNDFDSLIDEIVLAAADFLPSEIASFAPTLLGGALAILTGNPAMLLGGRIAGGVLAGVLEGGSTAVELARAGADFDVQLAGATVVGLANGTLEFLGNVTEGKTVESMLGLKKLYKQAGKNFIWRTTAQQLGKETLKSFGTHLAKEYVGGLIFEPLTEGAQEFVSMYVMNLASEWNRKKTGKSFTEEFTFTPQKMAENVWKTVKDTFKGQLLLGAGQGLMDVLGNLAPQYKEGKIGSWQFEAGQLMQILKTNNLQTRDKNSIFVDSKNVFVAENTQAIKPGTFTNSLGKQEVGKISSVNVKNINGRLVPVSASDMAKAQYMTTNNKYGMYVNLVEGGESTKQNASADEATRLVGKMNTDKPIYVSENGQIQVNMNDMDEVVSEVIKQLGSDYDGLNNGLGFVTIDSKDRQYTITSKIGNGSNPVTYKTIFDALERDKGTPVGIDETTFKKNLIEDMKTLGIKNVDENADRMMEWANTYSPVFDKLAEKLVGKVRTAEDVDGIKYGTTAMIARFMAIAGYDGQWAKDHIVIDSEITSGTKRKGVREYGESYWTDGNDTTHKFLDISSVPNRDNAIFHISLTDIADQTTGIHEVGHMALSMASDKFMSDEYFRKAFHASLEKDNVGVADESKWVVGDKTHEAFAEGLENYINTGVAQNKQVESIFKNILRAFKALVDSVRNKLTSDQQEFYDRMFGRIKDSEETTTETAENTEKSADYFGNSEEMNEEDYSDAYDEYNELEREGEEWYESYLGERYKREEGQFNYPIENLIFDNLADLKHYMKNYTDTVSVEGIKIVSGLSEMNVPLMRELLISKAINYIFGKDVILLPAHMQINEFRKTEGYTKSPDAYDAFFDGKIIEYKLVSGNTQSVASDIKEGINKSDDVIVVIKARSDSYKVGEVIDKIKEHPSDIKNKKSHTVIFIDANSSELNVYEIKKETEKSVSSSAQGLNEETRSRSEQLKDNILKQIVNMDKRRIDYESYLDASNNKEGVRKKREFEVDSFENMMRNFDFVSFYELQKYRNETDWVQAEYTAQKIIADGSLNWMSYLLRKMITEVKGENFSTSTITDEEWDTIAKNFAANAKSRLASESKSKTKKEVELFDGNDVKKVLMRLLAWDINTDETTRLRNWLNKYTGRNGKWNDREIENLARRMHDRGDFNGEKIRFYDGSEVSSKYRYLNMVYNTALKNKNYRSSRVGDAFYEGALKEITEHAVELEAMEQTYAPIKRVDSTKDEDIEYDVTNVTERDVAKARREADKAKEDARLAKAELEKLDNETTFLRANVRVILDELEETAKQLGINKDEYTTVAGLAEQIKKKGGKIAEDNVKLAQKNQDTIAKYEERIAELKEELSIAGKDYHALEIENRKNHKDAERYSKKLAELADKYRELQLSDANKKTLENQKKKIEDLIDKLNDLEGDYKDVKNELRAAWSLANLGAKKEEKLKRENKKLKDENKTLENKNNLNEAVIKQLDSNFAEVLDALEKTIKKKERVQKELWIRNEEMKAMRERNIVSAARKRIHKTLGAKNGDATQDKNLAFFEKAFMRREVEGKFIPTVFDKDVMASIENIAGFLNDKGLMKGNKLVRGFSDLQLSDYKAFMSAMDADKYNSKSVKQERVDKHNADVQHIANEAKSEIGVMTLSKKEKKEAKLAWLNGEYDSQEEAEKDFYEKKLKTTHAGTSYNSNEKKSLWYNTKKGLNLNNSFIFNSFTSFYNLLGSVSKKLRDAFYYGTNGIKGVNDVYDDYINRKELRKAFLKDQLISILGDEKKVNEFLKETQKNVEIKMLELENIPEWLMEQQTFVNFLGISDVSYEESLFEEEEPTPKAEFDPNYIDTTLNLEEVMAIYVHSKQNEDLAHILSSNGNNVSPYVVAYIANEFESEGGKFSQYRQIADAYQKAYAYSWDDFKRIANDVYDIALTRYEYYSPARSAYHDTDITIGFDFDINGIPHERAAQLTQQERADMQLKLGGDNAIRLDYVTGFNDIADSQEWFIAGAEFFKLWNDIMKNDGGGIRRQIYEALGSRVSDTVMKSMRGISHAVYEDIADNMNSVVSKIRNNMAFANLGFSMSSALQQPAVLAFATSEFGLDNMRSAISEISNQGGLKNFIDYVYSQSPQLRDIKDVNLSYAERAINNPKTLGALKLGKEVAQFGLKGMRATDAFSRCLTWEAGYRYFLGKDFTEEEAKKRATQACLNINTSTQAKDNALLYNSKSPFWKSLLMFTNQLNKNWNLLIGENGFGAIKEKKIGQFLATMCAFGVSTSMILIAKGKFFHNNDDSDEEWWKDLWKDYISQGVTVVPVIGDKISKAINGYSYLDSDIVNSTYQFVKNLSNVIVDDSDMNKQKVTTATKNFMVDLFELTGTPKLLYKNTYRSLFDDGRFVGDEFFTGGRWVGLLAPTEWFELITGEEV